MVSCKNPCVCRGRPIGDPGGYEPPLRVHYKIWERLHIGTRPVGEALSLPKLTQQSGSLNGHRQKPLSSVGVANLATRCSFAAGGRLRAAPTRCGGSRELTATNKVHPLSFAFAQQLPQRWSQGALRTCGRLRAAPTGCVESRRLRRWRGENWRLLSFVANCRKSSRIFFKNLWQTFMKNIAFCLTVCYI